MSWPAWPSFEFPPKELPVFLHPLRLIPYYKNQMASSLTSFMKRDDDRLFGPVEQAVTAIVVIGLELIYTPQSHQPILVTIPAHLCDRIVQHIPPSSSHLVLRPAARPSTSYWAWYSGSGIIWTSELKSRLKTSWNLFWLPWQERSLAPEARMKSPAGSRDEHDGQPTEHRQTSESRTSRNVPIPKNDQPVAKAPQAESTKVAKKAEEAISASRSLSKGKERMQGERPAEKEDGIGHPVKPGIDKAGEQPTAEEAETRKQLDKVRGKMVAIKQDSVLDESAKIAKLKELEKIKEKLKAKLSISIPAEVPPSAKTPAKQQSDPATAHKPTASTPDVDTGDQLAELKKKMKIIQNNDFMDETQKATQLRKLETIRQELKAKSAVTPPGPNSSPIEDSTTPKTPQRLSVDHSAPSMSPEDQKQLEKLKAKVMVVKADSTLSDADKAAKLSQLDKARQQLKHKAQASQETPKKDEKPKASSEPGTPRTVSTIARAATDLSPEAQKQLERLKGKMAAVKADKTLTESERATKLRELGKAGQILKVDRTQGGEVQKRGERSKSSTSPDSGVPTQDPSKTSDTDTDTGTDTASSSIPDDPLLSGESRQLKSALKKSKKKPRQKKNIHHNYIMTMRGWRSALVPFPHGLHPKPQQPRYSLWWDNVPKDADHIMASAKIAKVPEGLRPGEDESGGEGKKEKKEDKTSSEEGKKVLEKVDNKIPPAAPEDSTKKRSADSRGSGEAKEGDKKSSSKVPDDKKEEAAKLKAAAKAKEQAKDQEQAKAKAKGSETSATGKGVSPVPSASVPPPVDPQVQKATWVTQGMLCALIWFVHEQLALVLLGFFIWQHIQDIKTRTAALSVTQARATEETERKQTTSLPKTESSLAASGVRKLPSEGTKTELRAQSASSIAQSPENPAKAFARSRDPSELTGDSARKVKSVSSKPDISQQPLTSVRSFESDKTLSSPDSLTDARAQHAVRTIDPNQSTREVRSAAKSPATADEPKSRSSNISGKEPVTSSDRLHSGQGVDNEHKTLPPTSKDRGIDPKKQTPVAAPDDRRKAKPGSPAPSESGEMPDERLLRNDINPAGKRETPAGAGTATSPGKSVRARDPAVSKEPLTAIEGVPEPKRQGDLEAERGRQSERSKHAPMDNTELKAVVDSKPAFNTAESKTDGSTKTKHGTTDQSTTGLPEGALTPDMIRKLERVPLDKRDKYARNMLADAHRQAEDRPRTNQRRTADSGNPKPSTSPLGRMEAARSDQAVDGNMTAEAESNGSLPGGVTADGSRSRQDRANADDKVPARSRNVGLANQVTEDDRRGEDGPPLTLMAHEGDRRAVESAKAARREQLLRGNHRESGTQSQSAEQVSSQDEKGIAKGMASPLKPAGKRGTRSPMEMTAEMAKEHGSSLNERVKSKSEREAKSDVALPPSLLVTVEEGADGTLESDVPIVDLEEATPKVARIRRDDIEKLKEARRARLLAKTPSVQTPPKAGNHDNEAGEVSPISVYSQVTEAPSPKASYRLTRDVAAAREALLVDAPANGKHRRSSSVSSLDVIRFDGTKASRAMIVEGPRSAPIVPEVQKPKEVDVGDSPDRERITSTSVGRKRERAKTAGKGDDAAGSKIIDARRIRIPDGQAGDKGKAKSVSPSDVARDAHHREKVTRSTRDQAKRERFKRPAEKQSGTPERRSKHADGNSKDASEEEKRTEIAIAASKSSRDHSTKTKPDRKLQLEDLTPEQVEKMQKAREKRRLEKARAAKEALGQGSSGLSVDEKASLPSP